MEKSNLKKFIYFSTFLFVLSIFLGLVAAQLYPPLAEENIQQLYQKFSPIRNESRGVIFLYIFLNNSLIGFGAIISFFLFGLGPLFLLISNGFILGLALETLLQKESIFQLAGALLPHGIIEIPSFLLATATGFWLSFQFVRKIHSGQPFKNAFVHSMKIFFSVVLPLNLLAAFIEVYITPLVYFLL